MRLEITAENINVIATQNLAFFSIEDKDGSRIEVTLDIEMLDYLEEAIAREKRVVKMLKSLNK